ncbi:hypothetical protein [Fimbriiglobus ruber]|uniref:hypothetical protein n=1 Tax=Fimbriiglobus ruber TaxID=1908690 RepID=UPI00117B713C|nr:hypothetical protein [Fimbriiglobus ruber]
MAKRREENSSTFDQAKCPNCEEEQSLMLLADSQEKAEKQKRSGKPLFFVAQFGCVNCKTLFKWAQRAPRYVVGYHGCSRDFAESLRSKKVSVSEWAYSEKSYEWLGKGVYFWEDAPGRAWQWARIRFPKNPAVVATTIKLGACVDLADTKFTGLLSGSFLDLKASYGAEKPPRPLPQNRNAPQRPGEEPDEDFKVRKLDAVVVNNLITIMEKGGAKIQTVRCPFEEGKAAFPGAKIKMQSHVQIAVLDRECIDKRIWLIPEVM